MMMICWWCLCALKGGLLGCGDFDVRLDIEERIEIYGISWATRIWGFCREYIFKEKGEVEGQFSWLTALPASSNSPHIWPRILPSMPKVASGFASMASVRFSVQNTIYGDGARFTLGFSSFFCFFRAFAALASLAAVFVGDSTFAEAFGIFLEEKWTEMKWDRHPWRWGGGWPMRWKKVWWWSYRTLFPQKFTLLELTVGFMFPCVGISSVGAGAVAVRPRISFLGSFSTVTFLMRWNGCVLASERYCEFWRVFFFNRFSVSWFLSSPFPFSPFFGLKIQPHTAHTAQHTTHSKTAKARKHRCIARTLYSHRVRYP